jgi:aspartate/methionine/tyrosine aminotransferase
VIAASRSSPSAHDILIVADEIYAKMIYARTSTSPSPLCRHEERTITLNGFSKTYAMTGWRVGYLAAPLDFVEKVTEPRPRCRATPAPSAMFAALAALTGPQEPLHAMLAEYGERATGSCRP